MPVNEHGTIGRKDLDGFGIREVTRFAGEDASRRFRASKKHMTPGKEGKHGCKTIMTLRHVGGWRGWILR